MTAYWIMTGLTCLGFLLILMDLMVQQSMPIPRGGVLELFGYVFLILGGITLLLMGAWITLFIVTVAGLLGLVRILGFF